MPLSASLQAVIAPPNPLPITMASNVWLMGSSRVTRPTPTGVGCFRAWRHPFDGTRQADTVQ
jgi:hypothetical protein